MQKRYTSVPLKRIGQIDGTNINPVPSTEDIARVKQYPTFRGKQTIWRANVPQ